MVQNAPQKAKRTPKSPFESHWPKSIHIWAASAAAAAAASADNVDAIKVKPKVAETLKRP